MKPALKLEHVDLSYGTVSALEDVSLTIPQQTRTAIVGPTEQASPV